MNVVQVTQATVLWFSSLSIIHILQREFRTQGDKQPARGEAACEPRDIDPRVVSLEKGSKRSRSVLWMERESLLKYMEKVSLKKVG